jgi:hypothetical protein
MKHFIVIVSLSLFSLIAIADAPRLLLVKETGGLASRGTVKTCALYSNHPKIAANEKEITDLIEAAYATSELETTAYFVMAQIPSEEIYAFRPVKSSNGVVRRNREKVELLKIYGSREERQNDAAKDLVQFVNMLCQ